MRLLNVVVADGTLVAALRNRAEIVLTHVTRQSPQSAARPFPQAGRLRMQRLERGPAIMTAGAALTWRKSQIGPRLSATTLATKTGNGCTGFRESRWGRETLTEAHENLHRFPVIVPAVGVMGYELRPHPFQQRPMLTGPRRGSVKIIDGAVPRTVGPIPLGVPIESRRTF